MPHVAAPAGGGVGRARCGGRAPLGRRGAFAGRRCPAWWLRPNDPALDAGLAIGGPGSTHSLGGPPAGAAARAKGRAASTPAARGRN
eukprot:8449709-Lingulodinium_polyedra.AAC.1